jgi:hypothetical protein
VAKFSGLILRFRPHLAGTCHAAFHFSISDFQYFSFLFQISVFCSCPAKASERRRIPNFCFCLSCTVAESTLALRFNLRPSCGTLPGGKNERKQTAFYRLRDQSGPTL